nr:TnsA endonuclease N-terminal domain-containing protein [Mesobacillus selenatarsenatis]
MDKYVEYESKGESLFYFFLELDLSTIRYYVQPVEVPIKYYDENEDIQYWYHVPDVLVFRKMGKPILFQIKEIKEPSKRERIIDKSCIDYAESKGWEYRVIYPKALPDTIVHNINFLNGFTRRKRQYVDFIQEVLNKLLHFQMSTIEEMANSFKPKVDPLFIVPVIYHLIATGYIYININEKISTSTIIRPNRELQTILGNNLFVETIGYES